MEFVFDVDDPLHLTGEVIKIVGARDAAFYLPALTSQAHVEVHGAILVRLQCDGI